MKKEEKGEWGYEKIEEEKENNQYNSMKEINDECFYKFSSNVNNSDLLYFEDNWTLMKLKEKFCYLYFFLLILLVLLVFFTLTFDFWHRSESLRLYWYTEKDNV